MKLLFIGDIVGSPGRQIVADRLADIVPTRQIGRGIANGENSASGFGISPRLADELFEAGIEVLTGGNHIWDRKELLDYFPNHPRLLRPANFADINPGSGLYVGTARNGVPYAVLNLQGRVFRAPNDCPSGQPIGRLPASQQMSASSLWTFTQKQQARRKPWVCIWTGASRPWSAHTLTSPPRPRKSYPAGPRTQ